MRNIRRKVEEYQTYKGEQPTISRGYKKARIVKINDRLIEKIEIDQAIKKLTPRRRTIITLLFIQNKTIRKTAYLMGISKSTVYREAARAIADLETLLIAK